MLSVNADAKTSKGQAKGILTGVLYLAPHKMGGKNLCANSTPGCRAMCLFSAGRGAMSVVAKARLAKTEMFHYDSEIFMMHIDQDIDKLKGKAKRAGMLPMVRLNGTSDIAWEYIKMGTVMNTMTAHPDVQFYDYTKSAKRMINYLAGKMPPNYHLTFSRSECNEYDCKQILEYGGNVAVVFSTKRGEALPATWNGYHVIDGDIDDARPFDPKGVVVGLRAKGKARKDTSGFVVKV